jgi:hypothetical protein
MNMVILIWMSRCIGNQENLAVDNVAIILLDRIP